MIVKIWRARKEVYKYMTNEDYVKSSKREKEVADEIRKLSGDKIKPKFVGYGAGVSKKFVARTAGSNTLLDLEVENAFIEVMGSETYTFANSNFFPVALDKVQRAEKSQKPTYFVFVLDNEQQPNKWWIKYQKDWQSKYELAYNFPTIYGPQDIYKTNQNDWIRGLQNLVNELIRLTG
jgi:hypothetical protein